MTPTVEVLVDAPVVYRATWTLTADDPEGAPWEIATWAPLSVQVEGRFGPTGHVVLLGSVSGQTYTDLEVVKMPDLLPLQLPLAWFKPQLLEADADSRVVVTLMGPRR